MRNFRRGGKIQKEVIQKRDQAEIKEKESPIPRKAQFKTRLGRIM